MNEFLSWGLPIATGLALIGIGVAVLGVQNPLRVTFAKACFIFAGLVLGARVTVWGIGTTRGLWQRSFLSFLVFGLTGWVVVELCRFASHTQGHGPSVATPGAQSTPSAVPTTSASPEIHSATVLPTPSTPRPRQQQKAKLQSRREKALRDLDLKDDPE